MSTSPRLFVGRTAVGYRIFLEGKGTLFQSPVFQDLVDRCLQLEASTVVVDLSACEYLDSTFLGSLVTLHGRYSDRDNARLLIYAPPAIRSELFGGSGLDDYLTFTSDKPSLLGEPTEVDAASSDRDVLAAHVEEAHRRLAELGGSDATAFDRIARRVDSELSKD